MIRQNRAVITRHRIPWLALLFLVCFVAGPVHAQYSREGYNQYPYWTGEQDGFQQGWDQGYQPSAPPHPGTNPVANLQYDHRDAEMILRDQVARTQGQQQLHASPAPYQQSQQPMYDDYYGHRIQDEGQVGRVMAQARRIAQMISKKNRKAFVVIDKRNFQFYLYNRNGKLLRIGPVAVGKGNTRVGAFETPVGIFPITRKVPVDDWIRPDWYFIEEGEPIPARWEDRRVPGFFRYKLVFYGARYIHYAEATGGRLTHGCLGLDWEDAEAVFHTLGVGSYCIVIDGPFLARLAQGEFPITSTSPKRRQVAGSASGETSKADAGKRTASARTAAGDGGRERVFQSLW